MRTNGNDPAIPTDIWCESLNGGFYQEGTDPGLTKREYFAAMAMQALATNAPISSLTDFADIASDAVQFANALIDALNKETK